MEKGTFISSVSPYPEEEYFLGKSSWSSTAADWDQRFEVGDVVANPSGSWTPSTAEAYIDSQVATINTNLASETIARQTGDANLSTQLQSEMATRADQDGNLLSLIQAGLRDGDALVFDTVPTQNSANPVTSGGIYSTLRDSNIGFVDNEPIAGSDNLVTSGGVINLVSAPILLDLTKLNTVSGWVSSTGDCLMQDGSAHYIISLNDVIEITINANSSEGSYFTFATAIQPNGQYTKLSSVGRLSVNAGESQKFGVPDGANYLIVGVKSMSSSPTYTPSSILLSYTISELVNILEKQQMASINFFCKRYIDYDSVNGIVKIPSWGTFIYNNNEYVFGNGAKVNDYYEIDNVTNTELGTTTAYLVYDLSFTTIQTVSANPFSIVSFANIPKNYAVVAVIRLVASSVPAIYPQMTTMSPWSVNGIPYGMKEFRYHYLAPVLFFQKNSYIEYDSVNHTVSIGRWGVVYKDNKIYVFANSNPKYVLSNITNTEIGTTTAFLVFDTSLGDYQSNLASFSVINPDNIEDKHALIAIIRLVTSADTTLYPQITTLAPWRINGMPYGFSSLKEDDGLVLPLTPAAISSQGENKGITLNIMSYNVANYNDDTAVFLPDDKVIEFRRMLNDVVPDLVTIQEDREDIDGNGQKNAAQYLYNPVYPYLYIGGVQFPSVRSKVQTEVYGCLKYSNAERYFEYTTFQIEGKTLLFISTHIIASVNGSYSSAEAIQVRSVQYEETIKWANGIITLNDKVSLEPVSAPQHDFVVIAGDFNTITDDDKTNLLSVLSTYNYTCANGGKLGWIKTAPKYSGTMLSLDNIICSPNVVIESVKSYYELYDKLYSDHVPLLARVTLIK